jgi:hypothetical protein
MSEDGAETGPAPQSAGEAAKAVTEDVRRLVRAEKDLAKAEIQGQLAARGIAIGLLAIAGLLGLYIVGWLTWAIFAAWQPRFSPAVAALLTAAVLTGAAIVLGGIGALIMRRPMKPPERAQAAAQQTQEMVKQRLGRG